VQEGGRAGKGEGGGRLGVYFKGKMFWGGGGSFHAGREKPKEEKGFQPGEKGLPLSRKVSVLICREGNVMAGASAENVIPAPGGRGGKKGVHRGRGPGKSR